MSGIEGCETARIAGDLSGRSVFSLPHRAEALCFARAAFQADGSRLRNTPRFPPIALYLAFLRYVLVGLRVSQKKPVSRLTLNAGRVTLAA
jgi:hypothetical protein